MDSDMSSDRITRALRRKQTYRAATRQVALYHQANWHEPKSPVPGKFRKRKALNCGTSRCYMCGNPRYTWGRITLAEYRANITRREALAHIGQ